MQCSTGHRNTSLFKWTFVLLFLNMGSLVYGQTIPIDSLKADSLRMKESKAPNPADNINRQYVFGDLMRNVLHPSRKADTLKKRSGITVVPNIAANPTIGGQLGIKA